MTTSIWILLVIAVIAVLAFFSYMLRLMKKSRQIEKNLDYSKMRPWRDDD